MFLTHDPTQLTKKLKISTQPNPTRPVGRPNPWMTLMELWPTLLQCGCGHENDIWKRVCWTNRNVTFWQSLTTSSRSSSHWRCLSRSVQNTFINNNSNIYITAMLLLSRCGTQSANITSTSRRKANIHCVPKKSDAKTQITITTAYLIRIKYPFSSFNDHLSDVNVANFNKIHHTVSEQQLF